MAVRNCADLGPNLLKIVKRLCANQTLLKLLYYTDQDPLSHPDLTEEQISEEVFNNLIKVIPHVEERTTMQTALVLRIDKGANLNPNEEFKFVSLDIEIFTPHTAWMIKGEQLRPFAVMGELQKSLKGKRVQGMGALEGGGFDFTISTNEVSCYEQHFRWMSYD